MSTSEPMPRTPRPTTWLGAVGLVGLCLAVYLPGFFALPPVDRDESRFAQASRQMFESVALPESARDPTLHGGGLVVPRVQGKDRLNKPPLIYWLQAAAAAVITGGDPFRDAIWMYRVPSLLAAIAAVLMTWRFGASMFDARTGRLAAALLACCPVVAWEARQARADMVLLALNTATMLALWRIWTPRLRRLCDEASDPSSQSAPAQTRAVGRWPDALAFWTCIALAILTKGPVTPLIAGLAALSLCLVSRRWRWLLDLRPLLGIAVLAAIVAPWVVAVGNRVGWDVYLRIVVDETLGRSVSTREGHWGPPGYHTVLLPVLFWPGSLMTAAGIALALRQGLTAPTTPSRSRFRALFARRAAHPAYLFGIAWILPGWIIFELAWTKLPHYTLPLYPVVGLLSARALFAAEAGLLPGVRSRLSRFGRGTWLLIGGVLVVLTPLALPALDFNLGHRRTGFAVVGVFAALLGLVQIGVAANAVRNGALLRAQLAAMAAFITFAVLTLGVIVPRARSPWLSPRLAEQIAAADPERRRPLAAVRYHEDSLVFMARGRLDRIQDSDVGSWFRDHPDGIAVVPHLLGVGSAEPIGTVKGLNYSKGRVEEYDLIRGAP